MARLECGGASPLSRFLIAVPQGFCSQESQEALILKDQQGPWATSIPFLSLTGLQDAAAFSHPALTPVKPTKGSHCL